jgi:hypothetical protein
MLSVFQSVPVLEPDIAYASQPDDYLLRHVEQPDTGGGLSPVINNERMLTCAYR